MSNRVLITGASRGIGRAIALELADSGWDLALNYRSSDEAAGEVRDQVRDEGVEADLLPFDVSDRETSREVLEEYIEENGPFYGLVANAGIRRDANFALMESEDWDQVLEVNLNGFYNVVKPLLLPMISDRNGGRIVAVTSLAGRMGNPGQVNYSASKAGLAGAIRSLAREVGQRDITANCVEPGFIKTDMVENFSEEDFREEIPMGRFGEPEEVASVVDFLVSDRASYITGEVVSVNGGIA